jgi:hypothetical protein
MIITFVPTLISSSYSDQKYLYTTGCHVIVPVNLVSSYHPKTSSLFSSLQRDIKKAKTFLFRSFCCIIESNKGAPLMAPVLAMVGYARPQMQSKVSSKTVSEVINPKA